MASSYFPHPQSFREKGAESQEGPGSASRASTEDLRMSHQVSHLADTVSGTSVIPTPADFIVPQPRGLGMYLGGGPVSGTGDLGVSSLGTHPRGPGIYLGEDTTSKARALGLSDVSPQPTSRDEYLGEDTVTRAGSLDVSNFGTQGHEQVGHRIRANINVLKRNTLPFRPSPWPGPPTSTTSAPSPPPSPSPWPPTGSWRTYR